MIRELWRAARLGWVALIIGLGLSWIWKGGDGLLKQQVGVLAWKMVVVGSGVALAHVVRRQLFPYVDLSEIARQDDTRSGLFFVGMALFYAAVILALSTGL